MNKFDFNSVSLDSFSCERTTPSNVTWSESGHVQVIPVHLFETPKGSISQELQVTYKYKETSSVFGEKIKRLEPIKRRWITVIKLSSMTLFSCESFTEHNSQIAYQMAIHLLNGTL